MGGDAAVKRYEVSFEVEGPAAMFNRPDAGSTPISYPVPTYSALKGMFEAVARLHGAYLRPVRVEICRPIRFEKYATNYGGPLRKPDQIKKGNNYQLVATILVDVCYRVYGDVQPTGDGDGSLNRLHALQVMFERRLANGQWYYPPVLGWKEFVPTYFGPLRDGSRPEPDVNLFLPALLHSVFDRPKAGRVAPSFRRNVHVREGVINFEEAAGAE